MSNEACLLGSPKWQSSSRFYVKTKTEQLLEENSRSSPFIGPSELAVGLLKFNCLDLCLMHTPNSDGNDYYWLRLIRIHLLNLGTTSNEAYG